VSDVARVASPRGTRPWVLPRRPDDAHVAAAAASLPETLASVGWRVSTGPLVWNRRRADLRSSGSPQRVRVLWAADLDGGTVHRDPSRDRYRWIVLRGGDELVLVLDQPAVLVQRTTAPEQARRVVSVDLDPSTLAAWGGRVVVENHVNVIRPALAHPLISRAALAAVLTTRAIDRVMRCISGSVALSAYELESLPLPDAKTLSCWEGLRGDDLEQAVDAVYGLPDS
jgi:adenine-specific DNA-methyltransferase